MICLPCVPSLAAMQRIFSSSDQPEILHVHVPYMEYGCTHKHSLKRARQTHEKIRKNKAQPAYPSKTITTGSTVQVWLDQAVSCLKMGPPHVSEYSFKQMDPKETEIAVGENFRLGSKYAAESLYYSGCPAPRKIIADTGAAVDLIGARDLHSKDKQRNASEPIHFCAANGTNKADTIVQYYSSALGEQVSPHVLTDSVWALSIGKRVAGGCEFHWMPKENNNAGSCTLIKPDGKKIEFEVDEHDVPYLMVHRTTAVPASLGDNSENTILSAITPASQSTTDPETGQGGPWLAEDYRAARDRRLRSILKDTGPVPESSRRIDQPPGPIETDYSEVDAEEEQDLRRTRDKAFPTEDAKSSTHLCTHLPKNPYCTLCMRAKVNQKQNHKQKHTIDAKKFGDPVTGDHLISNGLQSNGIDGEAAGFLFRDRAIRFKQLYPAATKTAKECEKAFERVQGPMMSNRIIHLYTDGAPEDKKAGKNLRTCHDTGTPYRSATFGIAEREVRHVLEGTRTLLEHSGLPTYYLLALCQPLLLPSREYAHGGGWSCVE